MRAYIKVMQDTVSTTKPEAAAEDQAGKCCGGCEAAPAIDTGRVDPQRASLIREAFRLEYASLAWMVVEAAVAVTAGVAAGSLVLLAFGLDSLIEMISAVTLIWRLAVELRHGTEFSERAEDIARRVAGGLLFALAAYVTISAGWSLWSRETPSLSLAGIAVTAASIPLMRVLARRKIAVAERLGSRAMRADAMESITCGVLSSIALASLALQAIFGALLGAWWIDAAGSLVMVWFLIREGREAWSGEECCCD